MSFGANNQFFWERLEVAVECRYDCNAVHAASVVVREVDQDRTLWEGTVEIFSVIGHPKATRCFAWYQKEGGDGESDQMITMLDVPPITSPEAAVRAYLQKGMRSG